MAGAPPLGLLTLRPGPGADRAELERRLALAGCVAPDEEAAEILRAARGDAARLEDLADRRTRGEPLAWVVGGLRLCGEWIGVLPGVYVPRRQSELLARRAVERLPRHGIAVDLCTGSGALAAVMSRRRPAAAVFGTDLDPVAVRCANGNGVRAFVGDLDAALPAELGLAGRCDVVTAVCPYVPTAEVAFLPRDSREHEPTAAVDGGPDGLGVVRRAVRAASALLRVGGYLLVELGADQDDLLAADLRRHAFGTPDRIVDDEGDLRGIEVRRGARQPTRGRS